MWDHFSLSSTSHQSDQRLTNRTHGSGNDLYTIRFSTESKMKGPFPLKHKCFSQRNLFEETNTQIFSVFQLLVFGLGKMYAVPMRESWEKREEALFICLFYGLWIAWMFLQLFAQESKAWIIGFPGLSGPVQTASSDDSASWKHPLPLISSFITLKVSVWNEWLILLKEKRNRKMAFKDNT